jgi:hypothetical protein
LDVYSSIGDLSRILSSITGVSVVRGTFFSVGNIVDRFIEVSPDYERLDFPVEQSGKSCSEIAAVKREI